MLNQLGSIQGDYSRVLFIRVEPALGDPSISSRTYCGLFTDII